MTAQELREEVEVEIERINESLRELGSLYSDVQGRQPSVREKTAAAAFLSQFYTGIENILKRICRFHSVLIPRGDTWHVELFQKFVSPTQKPLPGLFDSDLAEALAPYRRFRHVVHHGYGFQLDWERMDFGIERAPDVFAKVRANLDKYLQTAGSLTAKPGPPCVACLAGRVSLALITGPHPQRSLSRTDHGSPVTAHLVLCSLALSFITRNPELVTVVDLLGPALSPLPHALCCFVA